MTLLATKYVLRCICFLIPLTPQTQLSLYYTGSIRCKATCLYMSEWSESQDVERQSGSRMAAGCDTAY